MEPYLMIHPPESAEQNFLAVAKSGAKTHIPSDYLLPVGTPPVIVSADSESGIEEIVRQLHPNVSANEIAANAISAYPLLAESGSQKKTDYLVFFFNVPFQGNFTPAPNGTINWLISGRQTKFVFTPSPAGTK